MGHKLQEKNYDARPSSDQRHILRMFGITGERVPARRVEAYLMIKGLAASASGQVIMQQWNRDKVAIRRRHAQPE